MTGKRSFWLFLLLASMLTFNGCAYYNYIYNAKKNFDKGVKTKSAATVPQGAGRADFDKVIDGCATMLEFFPDSRWVPDALLLIGKAYYETDQFSKAERKFVELETNYPNHPLVSEAHLQKARCWLALKRTREGRNLLASLQSNPDPAVNYSAKLILAEGLLADSLFGEALEQFNSLKGKAPDKILETRNTEKRLECLLRIDKKLDAIDAIGDLLKMKESRVKQHELFMKRASLWSQTGQQKTAIADLVKLEKNSDFRVQRNRTRAELSIAYFTDGDTTKALEIWDDLLSTDKIHGEETSIAGLYRGKLIYFSGGIDSLYKADFERSKRDRPGSIYAQQADSLLQRISWLKTIETKKSTALTQINFLNDLLVGNPVPDSIQHRYLVRANGRPTSVADTSHRSESDKLDKSQVEDSQSKPDQPKEKDKETEKNGDDQKLTLHKSIAPDPIKKVGDAAKAVPEKIASTTTTKEASAISSKGKLSKESAESSKVDAIHDEVKSESPDQSISAQPPETVERSERPIEADMKVAEASKPEVEPIDSTKTLTKIQDELTKSDFEDSLNIKALGRPDSTSRDSTSIADSLADVAVPLDTAAIKLALVDQIKQLIKVYDEIKDDCFKRKDTTNALKMYPTIMLLASGKILSAYRMEYGMQLLARGDTTRARSLYTAVAADTANLTIANAARKELQLALLPIPVDSLKERFRTAEMLVDLLVDTTAALDVYQSIAENDSGDIGSRATAAIAILQTRRLGIDSVAKLYENMFKKSRVQSSTRYAQMMITAIQDKKRQDSIAAHVDTTKALIDSTNRSDSLSIGKDSSKVVPDSLKLNLPDSLRNLIGGDSLLQLRKIKLEVPDSTKQNLADTLKKAIETEPIIPKTLVTPRRSAKNDTLRTPAQVIKPDSVGSVAKPDTTIKPSDTTKTKKE